MGGRLYVSPFFDDPPGPQRPEAALESPWILARQYYFDTMICVPRKIRELIADLEKAGFVNRGGKGGHRNFEHLKGIRVTLSGNPGKDAHFYQEREVKRKIQETKP